MTDDPPAKLVTICDFCGKRDTEVRKIIVGNRRDGQGPKICKECVSFCMSILMIEDREWFQKEVEEVCILPYRPP